MFSGLRSVCIRCRSCRTVARIRDYADKGAGPLTSNAGKKLPGKALYLAAWERHEPIALEKVEDTLSKQVCDNAYVIAEIEAVPKMYAFVSILSIIMGQCLEDA